MQLTLHKNLNRYNPDGFQKENQDLLGCVHIWLLVRASLAQGSG